MVGVMKKSLFFAVTVHLSASSFLIPLFNVPVNNFQSCLDPGCVGGGVYIGEADFFGVKILNIRIVFGCSENISIWGGGMYSTIFDVHRRG